MKPIYYFAVLLAVVQFPVDAGNVPWPAFRGPNSSGTIDATPPVKIGPSNSVQWKLSVPFSVSSPCVSEDGVFLTTYENGELQTRCYRRTDGILAWSKGIKPDKLELFHRTESSPASSSPLVTADQVVSYFGSFGLVCYDLQGHERWRYPMPMALSLGGYGTATCPQRAGRLVVVSHDQDAASSLVAVDLQTGRKVWETPRPDSYGSFGTPIFWRNNDHDEVVVPESLRLRAFDVATGRETWRVHGTSAFVCTTPVAAEGLLYFAAWCDGKEDEPWPTWQKFLQQNDKNGDGVVTLDEFDEGVRDYYRGYDANRDGKIDKTDWDLLTATLAKSENSLLAVKPGGRGDITTSHVAWKLTRGLPYVASPLYYEGRIYLVKNGGLISSLDPGTGKPFYFQERIGAEGNYYSSPVAAAHRIYLASAKGTVTVLKAGGDKPEILHQVNFGEPISASPALAGKNLYLRTRSTLYAFGSE